MKEFEAEYEAEAKAAIEFEAVVHNNDAGVNEAEAEVGANESEATAN